MLEFSFTYYRVAGYGWGESCEGFFLSKRREKVLSFMKASEGDAIIQQLVIISMLVSLKPSLHAEPGYVLVWRKRGDGEREPFCNS